MKGFLKCMDLKADPFNNTWNINSEMNSYVCNSNGVLWSVLTNQRDSLYLENLLNQIQ